MTVLARFYALASFGFVRPKNGFVWGFGRGFCGWDGAETGENSESVLQAGRLVRRGLRKSLVAGGSRD